MRDCRACGSAVGGYESPTVRVCEQRAAAVRLWPPLTALRIARAKGEPCSNLTINAYEQAKREDSEGCRRRRQVWLSGAEPDEQRNGTLERVERPGLCGRT